MIDQQMLDELGNLWRMLRSGRLNDPLALMRDARGLINKLPIYQAKLTQALAEMSAQGGQRSPRETASDARNLCRIAAGLLWAMRRVGLQSQEVHLLYAGLGGAYHALGRYERAAYRLRRALPVLRKQLPPGHDFYLAMECVWARTELALGRDAEILPDIDQVISRARDASCTSAYLQSLVTLRNGICARTGEREHAETVSQADLDDCMRRFGPESRESVHAMCQLALTVELPRGNVARANELLSQCLYILEANQSAPWVAPVRTEIEILAAEMEHLAGNTIENIRHLQTAHREACAFFADRDPMIVEVTLRLAESLEDAGRFHEALDYLKTLANDLEGAAWMMPAQRARFATIYTACVGNPADFFSRTDGFQQVMESFSFKENYRHFLQNFKEEIRRRRNWSGEDVQVSNLQEIWTLIGLHLALLLTDSSGAEAKEIQEVFLEVVEFKGRVAESMCISREQRLAVQYPEYRCELEELAQLRKRLQALCVENSRTQSGHELLNEKRRIEERLAEKIPELRWQPPTIESLAIDLEDIHEDCALLDFVHVGPPKDSLLGSYAVFILPAGHPEQIRMVALAGSEAIAEAIREGLLAPRATGRSYVDGLEELWARIWKPVESALEDIRGTLPGRGLRRLFISTDHSLGLLPFQILRNPEWPIDHYLVDEYEISYLSTSRDIVNIPDLRARRGARPVVIGLNNFDTDRNGHLGPASSCMFGPLRDAEDQAERVGKLLDAEIWKGAEKVTKQQVLESLSHVNTPREKDQTYRSPAVIHFALHGFSLGPTGEEPPTQFDHVVRTAAIQDALCRSGLALCGACASAYALRSSDPVPASLPGILSAYEISGLDLRDTQLVMLAVCKGGLGTLSSGEGVFGLQRSFFVAGAHSLIMALWNTNEAVTAKLVAAFYTQLCQGKSRSEALRSAQRQVREWFKDPALWGGFICQGNPLPIAQMVRPSAVAEKQSS